MKLDKREFINLLAAVPDKIEAEPGVMYTNTIECDVCTVNFEITTHVNARFFKGDENNQPGVVLTTPTFDIFIGECYDVDGNLIDLELTDEQLNFLEKMIELNIVGYDV